MDKPVEARVRDEALDWSIRVRDPGAGSDVRRELDEWIARDPAHARAWASVERSWARMNDAGPALEAQWSDAPRGPARVGQAVRRRSRTLLSAMAGIAACAVALICVPAALLWAKADYRTSTGDIRQVRLADGSTAHLDSGSAISLDYRGDRRGVTLLAGQAFFNVVHDRSRPFVVHVRSVDVTVIGTAFDVRRDGEAVDIAVERGAVRVASEGAVPVVLHPGDSLRVREDGIARTKVPVSRIAAWREGQIIVNGATVASVVAELGRYHRGLILLRNDQLGRQPVTGAYDIRNPEAALRAIVHPYGGQISTIGGLLLIVS